MSYILTGPATRDLDEIIDYIAKQSIQNAITVSQRLQKTFNQLSEFPGIGHRRDELNDDNARVVAVSGYLVIYDPTLKPLHILRVVRGARNLRRIDLGRK
jgi:toxin ParE1/3/4